MNEFITIRRWRLRDGKKEAELLSLVQGEFEPHYRELSGDVCLGLLRIDGTRSYFAVQYWKSRAHWESTTQSPRYAAWWAQYEPMLSRWDEIMEFEAEFESEDLLGGRNR